jgi:Transposase
MTSRSSTTPPAVRIAIDVAKLTHQVLIELPDGKRRAIRVANTKADLEQLVAMVRALDQPCDVAFEPTGDYHRPFDPKPADRYSGKVKIERSVIS